MKIRNTLIGVVGGGALAYLYLKTLGKDKNLNMITTLLIGAGVGGGIGFLASGVTSFRKGDKDEESNLITEEQLRELARSLNDPSELTQLETYLLATRKSDLTDADEQKVFRVIKGVLLAKKDNKWDENASMQIKKQILLNYGVTSDDFDVFQTFIVNKLSDIITDIFS